MAMFARADVLEVKCEARPGSSHIRPKRDPHDPASEFVHVWGVECRPCEVGHLSQDSHWAKNRHRVPLTPDEELEAQSALQDAARMEAQLKLIEARERQREYRAAVASGQLDGLDEPDDVVITTGSTSPDAPEGTGSPVADAGASYRPLLVKELRELARERGLPSTGSKSDLVARLVEYDNK